METIAAAIEAVEVAGWLRASRWSYPLVNALHLLGLAALFGAILTLDLRLLGLFARIDREDLAAAAVPVAVWGLGIAALSGVLLFAVRAVDYVAMPVFWAKIAFVGVGTAHALVARRSGADRRRPRRTAAVSLLAWTGAILAGRFIGYVEG